MLFTNTQKDTPSGLNQSVARVPLWSSWVVDTPDTRFSAKSHQHFKKRVSLPGSAGEEGAASLLSCVRNDQLLACKLIVKDGRPIPAVPSLTSHLIIPTDNRQSGTEGMGSDWLTGSGPGLYIISGSLGDKEAHQKNNQQIYHCGKKCLWNQYTDLITMSQVSYVCSHLLFLLFTEAGHSS